MVELKAQKWKLESLRIPPSSKLAILATEKQLLRFQRKAISPYFLCGSMLFALGLISLFTGHVASDIEWYSQRLVKQAFYSKSVSFVLQKNSSSFFLLFGNWKWNVVSFGMISVFFFFAALFLLKCVELFVNCGISVLILVKLM